MLSDYIHTYTSCMNHYHGSLQKKDVIMHSNVTALMLFPVIITNLEHSYVASTLSNAQLTGNYECMDKD